MPEELHEQVPLMKEVLTAMGVPILTKEGYEADDILGTIAKREQKNGYEVTILSGDRDLLQLSDTHIRICLPKTSPWNHGSTQLLPGGRDPGVPGNTGAVYRGEGPDGRPV